MKKQKKLLKQRRKFVPSSRKRLDCKIRKDESIPEIKCLDDYEKSSIGL